MVIGFWISLFVLIISFAIFLMHYIDSYYVNFYLKLIYGLLMGISLFGMMFCGYYSHILV